MLSILSSREYIFIHENISRKKNNFFTIDNILILFFFSFFSAIRWNVGIDQLSYLNNLVHFQNTGLGVFEMEYLFDRFTYYFSISGLHFTIYFFLLAFFQIFFLLKAFNEEKYLYPYIMIVFIMGPYYLSFMNGIRQSIVSAIFVFSIKYIEKKSIVKYFLMIYFCSFIHKSSLLLLPIYYFFRVDLFKNKWITLLLVFSALYVGFLGVISSLSEYIIQIITLVGYESYSDNMFYFIDNGDPKHYGPRMISSIVAHVIIIFNYKKVREHFKNSYFFYCYQLAIFGFLYQLSFMNANHIFTRPNVYFSIFSCFATAYVLKFFVDKFYTQKSILFFVLFFVLLVLSICYLPISLVSDYGKGMFDFSNFKFFFNYV
nr:EpsG family protein [Photobacterium carnosum]